MGTVTIGASTYNVYADVATADEYYNGSTDYATWAALSTDEKARALVSATRLLDRQRWQGTQTVDGQDLAWPRAGVVDCAGEAVDDSVIPQSVIDASMVLALYDATGSNVQTSATSEDLTKSLAAGSVSISYFRADSANYARFPLPVMELIGCFLAGFGATSPGVGALSYGTDGESYNGDFSQDEGF